MYTDNIRECCWWGKKQKQMRFLFSHFLFFCSEKWQFKKSIHNGAASAFQSEYSFKIISWVNCTALMGLIHLIFNVFIIGSFFFSNLATSAQNCEKTISEKICFFIWEQILFDGSTCMQIYHMSEIKLTNLKTIPLSDSTLLLPR